MEVRSPPGSCVEFGIRFVERPHAPNERQADPKLKDTLKEERSGILAWLVRGCLAWQEQGLAIPASISLATEKYRDEEDRILHFLTERCVIRPEVSIKASVLYEVYKAWCEENQFGRGMNATLFGNEIRRRFEKKASKSGRVYQGFGHVFAQNAKKGPYSGQNMAKPFTPFTDSSIENEPHPPSEDDAEQKRSDWQPFSNPSPHAPLPEGWEEFVL